MRRGVLVLLLVLSVGCARVPREVEIPIAVPCPAPPELPPLAFPLDALRPGATAPESIRALTIIIEMQKTRINSLEKILEGYRPPRK